jgi:hypothetical protein
MSDPAIARAGPQGRFILGFRGGIRSGIANSRFKIPEKSRKQPDFESGICNLESIPSANVGE